MRKRILGTAIILVWIAMVGWRARDEYFQPELMRLAEAALALAPGINFYTLTMGDRTIGQATSRLDTLPDGFELEDLMSLELPALGSDRPGGRAHPGEAQSVARHGEFHVHARQ